MCGFLVDISRSDLNNFDFTTAFNKIKYRGPDFSAVTNESISACNVTLGHHRLAIQDLDSRSNQPFKSECGNYSIVFNGEIFNFKSLRSELKDFLFRTESDTEVLLAGYEVFGEAILEKLDGFFSFIIVDRKKAIVFGAVDALGVKPLYFEKLDDGIRFGSELIAFRAEKFNSDEISQEALALYLQFSFVPAPYTIINSIRRLQSGCKFTYGLTSGLFRQEKYDYLAGNGVEKRDWMTLIREAVKSRQIADVPLGVLLSSGVDSTVVAALVEVSPNITTFTMGVNDPLLDERKIAAHNSKILGIPNRSFLFQATVAETLSEVVGGFDQPFSDPSAVLLDSLCNQISKAGFKVVLSADGGDEVFWGYRRHRFWYIVSKLPWILLPIKLISSLINCVPRLQNFIRVPFLNLKIQKMENLFRTGSQCYLSLIKLTDHNKVERITRTNTESSIAKTDAISKSIRKEPFWYVAKTMDYSIYLQQILFKLDRCGMRYGVEIREPFLQKDIVRKSMFEGYTFRYFLFPKYPLINFLKKIRNLKQSKGKKGFSVSYTYLLNSCNRAPVDFVMKFSRNQTNQLDKTAVEKLAKKFLEGDLRDSHILWGVYCYYSWMEKNVEFRSEAAAL